MVVQKGRNMTERAFGRMAPGALRVLLGTVRAGRQRCVDGRGQPAALQG